MANQIPLSLVIKAVDQATGPIKAMQEKIAHFTAPIGQLGKSLKGLGEESGITGLAEKFGHARHALGEVGTEAIELGKKLLELEVVGAFAMFEIVKGAVEGGAKLAEMSQRTGLGVDAYAQLQFAAGQAHVKADEFNDAMDQFNKRMGEAKAGGGPLLTFLEKVSPVLAKQVLAAKDNDAALKLMSGAFSKVTDSAKIAALTNAAFGRGSKNLGQFMHQGTAEIEKQEKVFFDLAGSQEEFAERSEEMEKASLKTEVAFTALRNTAVTAMLPALTEIASAATDFLKGNREGIKKWAEETGAALSAWVKGGGMERLTKSLGDMAKAVVWVVEHLGGLKGVAVILGAYLAGGFISSVVGAGGALLSLATAVVPVVISAVAGISAAFSAMIPMLAVVGPILGTAALAAAPFVLAAVGIGTAGYQIWKHWGGIKFLFKDTWNSIVFYVMQAWDKVKPILDAIAETTKSIFTKPGEALKTAGKFYGLTGGAPVPGVTAAAANPQGTNSTRDAHVTVAFQNAPKGIRVQADSNSSQPMDLLLGYTNQVPQ